MPVDFRALPPEEPEPHNPPSGLIWIFVFFVIAILCAFVILLLWPQGEATRSILFWMSITLYPTSVAAFFVLRRYSVFESRRLDAIAWNNAREKFVSDVFAEASRPLVLIAATYRFASDPNDDMFEKLWEGSTILEARSAPMPDAPPVRARWFDEPPGADGKRRFETDSERQQCIREWVFRALIADIADSVRSLPSDLELVIQLVLPGAVAEDEALDSWNKQWREAGLSPRTTETLSEAPDLMTFDTWLDQINQHREHKARLLVLLRLNEVIRVLAPNGSAEAGVALLVVPEHVQDRLKIEPVAKLHRPNETEEGAVGVALARALRWGRTDPDDISRIWKYGLELVTDNSVATALVKAGIEAKQMSIDCMVGQSDGVGGWLGVVCAAKAVAQDGAAQLVVAVNSHGPCFAVVRGDDAW
ncbi:hypothetical protein H0X90_31145 [Burkholderia sp. 9775_39]|uniref:hypothetical protein n=1 Tax=unclassified Burkholderia TaxID=2613784 RepID=UPI0018C38BB5|nr:MULTISPECIES: hypothetical protein [unclassified Burkholderia]MBG0881265.1 hypothetical protein [Burkholderia sp. 9775_39]MBG0887658.1 hypothetical protein [Burkholderia sp. 9773_38]